MPSPLSHTCNGKTISYFIRDAVDASVFAEIFHDQEYKAARETIVQATYPILDVGAHVGFFSLRCHCYNPTVPIFALEPAPENYTLLEKHCKENNIQTITPCSCALSAASGEASLLVHEDSISHKIVQIRDEGKNNSEKEKSSIPHTYSLIPIPCFSFPDFCVKEKVEKISLLKMDIEGGEYAIFASLHTTDWAKIGAIILEYHTDRTHPDKNPKWLTTIFAEHGFSVQHFPSHYEKTLGFLFARNKRFCIHTKK